jgi:hypothetical protein
VYKRFKGWSASTTGTTTYRALPVEAKRYLQYIEESAECRIDIISTGSKRDATIVLKNPMKVRARMRPRWTDSLGTVGSSVLKFPTFSLGEPLAQTVEHRPFKARALGSSPRRLTTSFFATTYSRLFKDQTGAGRNGSSIGLDGLEVLVTVAHEAKEWIAAHVLKRWAVSVGSLRRLLMEMIRIWAETLLRRDKEVAMLFDMLLYLFW